MELTEWVRLGGKSSTEMPQAIAVYSVVCGWLGSTVWGKAAEEGERLGFLADNGKEGGGGGG